MAGLADSIASEENLIKGPVVLGARDICVITNVPSGLRRQFAGKERRYRIIGPGGTYKKITGLPVTGENYGFTLTTDSVIVTIPVEDVAIANNLSLSRVDVELSIQLDARDREFGALNRFIVNHGPGFLGALDSLVSRDVSRAVRRSLRDTKPKALRSKGDVPLPDLEDASLLDGVFRVHKVICASFTYDTHFREILDALAADEKGKRTQKLQINEKEREAELERVRQRGEQDRERAQTQFALEMAQQLNIPVTDYLDPERGRIREEKAFELVQGLVENLAKVRQTGGQAAVEQVMAFINMAMPTLAPPSSLPGPVPVPSITRGDVISGTAFTDTIDADVVEDAVRLDPELHERWLERNIEIEPWALGRFSLPPGEALLVAASRPVRPRTRTAIREAFGEFDEFVVLAPVDSIEALMLAFVLHYAPALEEVIEDTRCEITASRVTLFLSAGSESIRPLLRPFTDPGTRRLDGLMCVIPNVELDVISDHARV